MKRIIATLIAVTAISANANLIIGWSAAAGFYDAGDGANGILDASGSTIARLVYSPDNTRDNVLATGTFDVNDQVLATYIVTFPGTAGSTYADFTAPVYNSTFLAGFVYAQIFDKGGNTSIDAGMQYYNSPTIATTDLPANGTPQGLQLNTDVVNGNLLDRTVVAVPEPATYAFMGIGALLLFIRRMRRS